MVVGAGIAGIQSALDLADSGYKVYLVDRNISIGGVMAQLDKTFPTNDCSTCMISPKLIEVASNPNIQILSRTEVLSLEGEPGHFTAKLRRQPRFVDEQACTGCGACEKACPVKVPAEFNQGLNRRKAIYRHFPQAIPSAYAIDKDKCVGCNRCLKVCQAEAIHHEMEPEELTLTVGAVVLSPGFQIFDPEQGRPEFGYGRYANVVTSLEFERINSASGPYAGHLQRPGDGKEPKRVAWIQCVGSRDSAIGRDYCSYVCCMYAAKQAIIAQEHVPGLEATIFYMDVRAQGKGFDRYYERARDERGVRYVRSIPSRVIEDPASGDLLVTYLDPQGRPVEERFDMLVLSVGLVPHPQGVECAARLGVETDRFGFSQRQGLNPLLTSRPGVFVCGVFQAPRDIPDTVMQASGAAAEAGALLAPARGSEVTVIDYPPERPVDGEEPRIGVFVCHCGINIAGVVDVPAVVEYARGLPGVVDARDFVFTCSTDSQKRMAELIQEKKLNRVVVASCSPRTHEPLFRDTMRRAGLNPYLFEMANIRDQCSWVHQDQKAEATDKAKDLVRMSVARAAVLAPLHQFPVPVEQSAVVIGGGLAGLTAALTLAEMGFRTHLVERSEQLGGLARRLHRSLEGFPIAEEVERLVERVNQHPLIQVHLSSELVSSSGHVGSLVSVIRSGEQRQEVVHGAAVVAVGAREYTPQEYAFGRDPRITTHLSLHQRLWEEGAAALEGVDCVVMIQCVGSREPEHSYCSRVCCSQAVANALRIKELRPDCEVAICFRDLRTYSLKELYYKEAREKGVHFLRFDPQQPPQVEPGDQGVTVRVWDLGLQAEMELKADIVSLAAAVRPQEGSEELASSLKLPLDADGFFMEAHLKLRPVDFVAPGWFVAGGAHGPKPAEEVIAQAKAAASRAATVLSRRQIQVGGVVAVVDEERCAACLTCVRTCPYGVPRIRDSVAYIDPAKCYGCGACAAECPGKAITLQHFTDAQILAKATALWDWIADGEGA
jgi:heterodisulfide reductase subunit A